MNRPSRLGVVLVLVLMPALALAGRIFQWTDDKDAVHVTDNLWELPAPIRTRYLELIEEEARSKYSVQQIKEMKEAGNWPPLEFIRPKVLKSDKPLTEWMGLKLLADDFETQRAIGEEYRFQWDRLRTDERQLTEGIAAQQQTIARLTDELERTRFNDMVNGVPEALKKTPAAQKTLDDARQELVRLQAELAAMPDRRRKLVFGERVYKHPGEDGGPSHFGAGLR